MDYKVAKLLKDAGFPQNAGGLFVTVGGCTYRGAIGCDVCEGVSLPTLSELVEACRHNFWKLQLGAGGQWFGFGEMGTESVGDTPEEAVAKLWLALNS